MFLLASGLPAQENLTLSGALAKALDNNYGILISRSEEQVATIHNNWGSAGRYPTVGFDVTASNNYNVIENTSSNRFFGGVGLN